MIRPFAPTGYLKRHSRFQVACWLWIINTSEGFAKVSGYLKAVSRPPVFTFPNHARFTLSAIIRFRFSLGFLLPSLF
ncbi:hypothetical protein HMPREF9371_0784 [Neisseria shayeganii 871]|uniref:Uncharacterized protein n=1 Tax=Neisseria shayeganii 871 TaxID=1032488 RepID=G4CGP5_9NEIS|nr:hypothetical protein HMPREF9371_0784 [Neisseria shayeganii 871]